MASSDGWALEPVFDDALAGSGGTADPVLPWSSGVLVGDLFPDALIMLPPAATPAGGSPAALASGTGSGAAALKVPVAPRPVTVARQSPPAPGRRPGPSIARPAPGSGLLPWSQFPPPGQPAAQYVPVPTSAQLAPGPGRRPTAGLGYTGGPRPIPATAPGGLVRPPAYLPQNQGAAQLRAALQQARQRSRRPPRPAVGSTKSKAAGLWSSLVFLVVVLVPSGLGQRIITAIAEVFQRR